MVLFFGAQVAAFVGTLFYAPVFAFLGYQVIYLMYHSSRWWYHDIPALSYSFAFSAFVVLLAFFSRKKATPTQPWSIPSFRWLYLLLLYYALIQLWAFSPVRHFDALDNFAKLVIVMSAAFKLCGDRRSLDLMLQTFMAGAAYLGYYTYQFGRTGYGRVENVGTVDSPDVNDVAALLVPAAVLALYYFWAAGNHKQRMFAVLCGAFIVNAIVLMNSRGAFLGLFLGAAYFLILVFMLSEHVKASRAKVIGIGLLGVVALGMVFDQSAIERFLTLKDETEIREDQQTGSTRIFFWKAAMSMSFDYPLGVGSSGFVQNSHLYIPEHVNTGGSKNRAVHSVWFQALSETGYVGAFSFVMVLYASLRMIWRVRGLAKREEDLDMLLKAIALESALLSYLIAATFLDRMRAEVLYWLVLFIACAYNLNIVRGSAFQNASVPQQVRQL